MVRAPAGDEDRRQDDVEAHGRDLHHHARLGDAGAAQHRADHREHELQREAGQRPQDERHAGLRDGRVGGHTPHVRRRQAHAEDDRRGHAGQAQQHGLPEHAARAGLVLGAQRVRHQRHGADAQHLRQRDHEQRDVAGRRDAGDGFLADAGHEIQVDHEVHRLHQHADGDGDRHGDEVAPDGALGEVAHSCFLFDRRSAARLACAAGKGWPESRAGGAGAARTGFSPRRLAAAAAPIGRWPAARAAAGSTGGTAPGACAARAGGPGLPRRATAPACGTRCSRPCAS